MAIDNKEFEYEINKLNSTIDWINKDKQEIEYSNKSLDIKISGLKKEAQGRYNEELEIAEGLKSLANDKLSKYYEALNKPYFARIDFREYKREEESFYIGKHGLGEYDFRDDLIIDWRAPVAELYYSGTEGEAYYEAPKGLINGTLSLKRKFVINNGELIDAFDELNEIIIKSSNTSLIDEFLKLNLESSISGKLKDVVATIQKEQNEIIRAGINSPLIVQGFAGSGKTTVALHRLAYLLYKHKNTISANDILVIAPNKLFLDYISDLLPSLGVHQVKQSTFEDLALEILNMKYKVISKDVKLLNILEGNGLAAASSFKNSYKFKEIIDCYVEYLETEDANVPDITVDQYVLFTSGEVRSLFKKDLSKLPINKRKDEIQRYFQLKLNDRIHDVLSKIEFTYEYQVARIKKSMEDCVERREKFIKLYDERDGKKKDIIKKAKEEFKKYFLDWKHGEQQDLYLNFINWDKLPRLAFEYGIESEIIEYMRKSLDENIQNGYIDSDDIPALLYLRFKVMDIPKKYYYKCLFVDEAQDYSIFQLTVMKMLTTNNGLTLIGDLAQGIYSYKGIEKWEDVLDTVFLNEGRIVYLSQSYRSTYEIIEFANIVLKKHKSFKEPAKAVLRHGRTPEVIKFNSPKEFSNTLDGIVNNILLSGKTSIAVIGKTLKQCKEIKAILKKHSNYNFEIVKETDKELKLDKIIIPSYLTKGLEFDCVIVYDCNDENYKEEELDKKLLYVVLTRALHEEYVFYSGNLSNLLL